MTKAATQALNSQLSALESYADSSPMADLAKMAARKASQAQAQAQKLADLKSHLPAAPLTTPCARA